MQEVEVVIVLAVEAEAQARTAGTARSLFLDEVASAFDHERT